MASSTFSHHSVDMKMIRWFRASTVLHSFSKMLRLIVALLVVQRYTVEVYGKLNENWIAASITSDNRELQNKSIGASVETTGYKLEEEDTMSFKKGGIRTYMGEIFDQELKGGGILSNNMEFKEGVEVRVKEQRTNQKQEGGDIMSINEELRKGDISTRLGEIIREENIIRDQGGGIMSGNRELEMRGMKVRVEKRIVEKPEGGGIMSENMELEMKGMGAHVKEKTDEQLEYITSDNLKSESKGMRDSDEKRTVQKPEGDITSGNVELEMRDMVGSAIDGAAQKLEGRSNESTLTFNHNEEKTPTKSNSFTCGFMRKKCPDCETPVRDDQSSRKSVQGNSSDSLRADVDARNSVKQRVRRPGRRKQARGRTTSKGGCGCRQGCEAFCKSLLFCCLLSEYCA